MRTGFVIAAWLCGAAWGQEKAAPKDLQLFLLIGQSNMAGRGAVEAQVAVAIYQMGIASSILPLICLCAAIWRWRRTR